MNTITNNMKTGTVGEILVQLRLLEHNIQAAPPLKDSGNDLIAIRGKAFRAIQVKTTTGNSFNKNELPELYHILAVVQLFADETRLLLDKSCIFLIPYERIQDIGTTVNGLAGFEMTPESVNELFREE